MSILQVAKHAGVSPATVSRVVNGRLGVSQANVSRVQEVMRDLRYEPRRSRKNGGVFSVVALLVLSKHNFFHHNSTTSSLTWQSIREELARHQMNLIVADVSNIDALPPVVARHQVDGLIMHGHHPDPQVLKAVHDLPQVWLTSHHHTKGDALLPGNEQVGRLAAEYLHSAGCQSLGVFNTMTWSTAINSRVDYFKFTCGRLGYHNVHQYIGPQVAPGDPPSRYGASDFEFEVSRLIDQIVADPNRPQGLFVPMDLQTALVHRQLLKRGLVPGRDILLIGSDNVESALLGLWPRPASVSLRSSEVGRLAVQQLLERIANPAPDEHGLQISIQPLLISGEMDLWQPSALGSQPQVATPTNQQELPKTN